MQAKSKQGDRRFDARAQRLVVLQVAGALYGRSREQLQGTLSDLGAWRVNKAIKSLEAVGLVVVNGRTIRQSRALARIERLGFIEV
jgi:stage V sporulation protein SpoVS